jgi:hypothetical protein
LLVTFSFGSGWMREELKIKQETHTLGMNFLLL